jgi:dTDP-4-dehydrorhamnose reductase
MKITAEALAFTAVKVSLLESAIYLQKILSSNFPIPSWTVIPYHQMAKVMLKNSSDSQYPRILITGITSIHGWPIYKKLKSMYGPETLLGIRPPDILIPDDENVTSICMTDLDRLMDLKSTFHPTHILHAAGVCDLDACEQNPQFAYDINVQGACNIVSAFSDSCYIMYLSSDLVYSGNTNRSHGYFETDPPDPVSVVGKTYVQAEKEISQSERCSIIRIGLPMGDSIQGKKGAVDFIENRLKRGLPMSLFYDEYRSCIGCDELADTVTSLFSMEVTGLFHIGGPHAFSLYEIGERILKRGNYRREALRRLSRTDEINGPPRIGNVHLNSGKAERVLGRFIQQWEF